MTKIFPDFIPRNKALTSKHYREHVLKHYRYFKQFESEYPMFGCYIGKASLQNYDEEKRKFVDWSYGAFKIGQSGDLNALFRGRTQSGAGFSYRVLFLTSKSDRRKLEARLKTLLKDYHIDPKNAPDLQTELYSFTREELTHDVLKRIQLDSTCNSLIKQTVVFGKI